MDENLFEEELTIEALSAMGNLLEQLSTLVYFEMFRPELEDVLVKKDCKIDGRPSVVRCCLNVQSHILTTLLWLGRQADSVSDYRPHQFPPIPWHTYSG